MISYSFHWNQAFKALPQMLDGALVTLQIAILSMVVGLAVALALTLFRLSGNRALSGFATGLTRSTGGLRSGASWGAFANSRLGQGERFMGALARFIGERRIIASRPRSGRPAPSATCQH